MFNIDKSIKKLIPKSSINNPFNLKKSFLATPREGSTASFLGRASSSFSFNKSINKLVPHRMFRKNDSDGDGIVNKKDCQPRNIMRQDMIIALSPKNKHIKAVAYVSPRNKSIKLNGKELKKGTIYLQHAENIEPEDVSQIIEHEEIHDILNKEIGPRTSGMLDSIAVPHVSGKRNPVTSGKIYPTQIQATEAVIHEMKERGTYIPGHEEKLEKHYDRIKRRNEYIWSKMTPEERNRERVNLQDTDGDRVPDKYDCQPDNIMRQDSLFSFRKKEKPLEYVKSEEYPEVDDPEFIREQQESNTKLQQYGEVKDYSGKTVGNVMIGADVVIPSGKVLTIAGIGVKKYVDKVKFVKTDEHDKPYIIPKVEVHRKGSKLKWSPKHEGASLEKQEEWKQMSAIQRNNVRQDLPDSDGDRVPDQYDCQPNNIMRQDTIYSVRPYREKFAKRIIPTDLQHDYYYDKNTNSIFQSKFPAMSGRGTGWFGSGVYGFATREQAEDYQKLYGAHAGHPGYIREFEIEKPFKPATDYESELLHTASKEMFRADSPRDFENVKQKFEFAGLNVSVEDIKKAKQYSKISGEQPINYLLRKKGYGGVIPTDKFQNTSFGSVLHVARPEQIPLDINKQFTEEELERKREYQEHQREQTLRHKESEQKRFHEDIQQVASKPRPVQYIGIPRKEISSLPFKVEGEAEWETFRKLTPEEQDIEAEKFYSDKYKHYKAIKGTFEAMDGASIEKQQEWKQKNEFEKDIDRITLPDSDGDGVPNQYDVNSQSASV
jgi:hypothetical protein